MNLGGANGHKNKIFSILIVISVIVINFTFITPARAAISGGALISMANSARASAGVHTLGYNSALASSAQAKARDMLKYNYFAHTSPQGKSPWSFIGAVGYSYIYAGENLAIDFSTSGGVHNAWMASSTHRANILDKDFTEIGIAVVSGAYQGRTTTVVVQHFGARASAPKKSYQPAPNQNQPSGQNQPSSVNLNSESQENQPQKPEKVLDKEIPKKLSLDIEIKTPEIELKENQEVNLVWITSPILMIIKIFL